jgi:hypothetical protein
MSQTYYEEQISELNLPDGFAEEIINLVNNFLDSEDSEDIYPYGEAECHSCNGEGGGDSDHWSHVSGHYTSRVKCDTCDGRGKLDLDYVNIQDIEDDLRRWGKFNKIIPSGCVDAKLFAESLRFDKESWRRDSGDDFERRKIVKFDKNVAWVGKKIKEDELCKTGFDIDCLHFWTLFYGNQIEFIMKFEFGIVREEAIREMKEMVEITVANVLKVTEELCLSC